MDSAGIPPLVFDPPLTAFVPWTHLVIGLSLEEGIGHGIGIIKDLTLLADTDSEKGGWREGGIQGRGEGGGEAQAVSLGKKGSEMEDSGFRLTPTTLTPHTPWSTRSAIPECACCNHSIFTQVDISPEGRREPFQ